MQVGQVKLGHAPASTELRRTEAVTSLKRTCGLSFSAEQRSSNRWLIDCHVSWLLAKPPTDGRRPPPFILTHILRPRSMKCLRGSLTCNKAGPPVSVASNT